MAAEQHYDWASLLFTLSHSNDLSEEQLYWAMDEILNESVSSVKTAAFVMGLTTKKITSQELNTITQALVSRAKPFPDKIPAIDIVGTGGDKTNSFNISSMASVVAASAGATIIKHGSRSVSSKSGGADMLEKLGVDLEPDMNSLIDGIRTQGFGFCFAPFFHPLFVRLAPLRRELGIPTFLNWVGPLINPAGVHGGLLGCASQELMDLYADIFMMNGRSGLIVRGNDGLDEITTTDSTTIYTVLNNTVKQWECNPQQLGITLANSRDLEGGSPEKNAEQALEVFQGVPSPILDAVLINAGAALAVAHTIPYVYRVKVGRNLDDATYHGMSKDFLEPESIQYYTDLLFNEPHTAIAQGIALAQKAITQGYTQELMRNLIVLHE